LSVTNDHQLAASLRKMADAHTCRSSSQQQVSSSRKRSVLPFVVAGEAGSNPVAHACCLAMLAAFPHKKSTWSNLMA
jgi:hypothetical protein